MAHGLRHNMMHRGKRPPPFSTILVSLFSIQNLWTRREASRRRMENGRLRRPFSDATHEEAKQYVKSSALIVLKLPAINSLCPRVMVLSCFLPVASVIPALSAVLSCESFATALAITLSPSNRLPSFLPSLQFFLPSLPRSGTYLLLTSLQPVPTEYLWALWMHGSRGKLNSFYLFIRAVVSQFLSLLLSFSLSSRSLSLSVFISFSLFLSISLLFELVKWKFAEEDVVGARRMGEQKLRRR